MGINRSSLAICLIIFIFVCFSQHAFSGERSSFLTPGATIKLVQSGFQGAEGPAVDAEGNVYFTDTFPALIYKWTWEDGKISLYKEKTGKTHGLAFDTNGRLVMTEFAEGRVTRDDMKGNITVLADSCDGKKLHTPNKLWIDPKGGIYFSDMYIPAWVISGGGRGQAPEVRGPADEAPGQAPAGKAGGDAMPGAASGAPPKNELGIVYITPDTRKVIRVANDLDSPNGLIGTPDGKTFYAADRNKVWSYKINPDGTLTGKKLFCEKNTDGFAIDEKNNVYLGDKSLFVYSPAGELLEEIPTPEGISNLKFAGKERKTLFITHRTNVYTLEMTVKGAPTVLDLASGTK
jgi:gluconolactonase